MAKKTKGKGALFEQEQREREEKAQARRDKDAKAKREKRAAARANRDAAPETGRAPHISAGYTKGVNQKEIKITMTGVVDTPANRETFARAFAGKAEPVPVRLTLAALAKAFDDACTHTETAQAVLEDAVRQQAKAKEALDQACSRRANGERA